MGLDLDVITVRIITSDTDDNDDYDDNDDL